MVRTGVGVANMRRGNAQPPRLNQRGRSRE